MSKKAKYIFLFLLLGLVVFGFFTKQNAPIDYAVRAKRTCKESIYQTLHDPDSAKFEASSVEVLGEGNHIFDVTWTLRAKNAYNAMRLGTYKCRLIRKENGQWFLKNIESVG